MDASNRKYSADELLQYAYKYNQIPVILFAKDKEGRYIYTSEVENLVDGGKEHSILGKTDMDIQYDSALGKEYYEQDRKIIETGESCHFYSELEHGERKIYKEISKNPVYINGEVIGVCGVVMDVTELMTLKKNFETLTFYDKLTGIYNRNYLLKFDFNKQKNLPCAYIMCDCNDLKGVNDRLGHCDGDIYIRETAEILKASIPTEGICIRYGGDEFLAVIPNCDEADCQAIVDEINGRQLKKQCELPYMNIALGYCVRHDMAISESEIIEKADQRMYADKKKRKMDVWR